MVLVIVHTIVSWSDYFKFNPDEDVCTEWGDFKEFEHSYEYLYIDKKCPSFREKPILDTKEYIDCKNLIFDCQKWRPINECELNHPGWIWRNSRETIILNDKENTIRCVNSVYYSNEDKCIPETYCDKKTIEDYSCEELLIAILKEQIYYISTDEFRELRFFDDCPSDDIICNNDIVDTYIDMGCLK